VLWYHTEASHQLTGEVGQQDTQSFETSVNYINNNSLTQLGENNCSEKVYFS